MPPWPATSLAAYTGAALGLVPLPRAQEAIDSGVLTEELSENFSEVVNILASVFNENAEAPHLELYTVHVIGGKLPTDVASRLGYGVRRLDRSFDVAGYGAGRLSSGLTFEDQRHMTGVLPAFALVRELSPLRTQML